MPSALKRFSTLLRSKDSKEKRKSLKVVADKTDALKKPEPLRSEGKKIVVVAGASVGLGAELVKKFSTEFGTYVIALDATEPSSGLKALLSKDVVSVKVASSSDKDIAKAKADVQKLTGGRIDILINNAVPAKHSHKALSSIGFSDISSDFSAIVTGPIAITNALVPSLKKFVPPPPPPAPVVEAPAEVPKENGAETNGTDATAEPKPDMAEAAPEPVVEAPAPPPEPTIAFPANPVVVFITTSSEAHSIFPPAPLATHAIAHAALNVAIKKYTHDLGSRGIVVFGIEANGWNDADALTSSTDAVSHVAERIETITPADNGKLLRA